MHAVETAMAGVTLGCHEDDGNTMTVNGLSGLSDFAAVDYWVRQMTGQFAMDHMPPACVRQVQKKLDLSQRGAKQAIKDAVEPNPEVVPRDVLTAEGAQKIAKAGRRAQAAARFHNDNANKLDASIKAISKRLKTVVDSGLRTQLEGEAASKARSLLAERAQATRAVLVAGATLSALKFRQKALQTKDETQRRAKFGQAAASIDAGKHVARTKLKVTLPKALTEAGRAEPSPGATPVRFVPSKLPAPSSPSKPQVNVAASTPQVARRLRMRTAAIPDGINAPTTLPEVPFPATDIMQPTTGVVAAPQGIPFVPSAATEAKGLTDETPPIVADRTITANLAGIDGLGDFSFDSVLQTASNVASAVLPAASAVSSALQGQWGNAVGGGIVALSTALNGPQPGQAQVTVQYQQAAPGPLTPQLQQVNDSILNSAAQTAPPDMPNTPGLPKWIIPAGVATALGVGAVIFLL